ncbi:MAG: hypothetical protein HFE73_03140 [Firmicutes bacterium]|nr:hypothetical protein [Bacillota bacterium]
MDDNRIVELYLLRDEAAIQQTAEKFGSRLRSLAYGIVNDQQTANECENYAISMPQSASEASGTGGLYVMRGNEFIDKMELMDFAYVEAADAVPQKRKAV